MSFLPPDFMFQTHDHQDFSSVGTQLLKRSMSFSGRYDQEVMMNGDDELSDDGSQAGEKKKIRLNLEQVKALEKSFELGNKLEPERKMQLAKALNMQPRQVAIWFQNRRARWKTKQLEKDYDILKKQFDALKVDNGALKAQNKKLHAELMALRSGEPIGLEATNIKREADQGSWSNGSKNTSDHVNLNSSIPSQLSFKQLFPPFKHTSSIIQQSDLQCPKIDQIGQDESFCNMFCSVDDQSGLWPWQEQHQFE